MGFELLQKVQWFRLVGDSEHNTPNIYIYKLFVDLYFKQFCIPGYIQPVYNLFNIYLHIGKMRDYWGKESSNLCGGPLVARCKQLK